MGLSILKRKKNLLMGLIYPPIQLSLQPWCSHKWYILHTYIYYRRNCKYIQQGCHYPRKCCRYHYFRNVALNLKVVLFQAFGRCLGIFFSNLHVRCMTVEVGGALDTIKSAFKSNAIVGIIMS